MSVVKYFIFTNDLVAIWRNAW